MKTESRGPKQDSDGKPPYRSGFIAVVGRPNTGKSTLVNTLARRKIAIISEKPQTTRHAIRAVITLPGAQMILIDTPGIHKPQHTLGEHLNRAALRTLEEVDVIVFLVDALAGVGEGDRFVAAKLGSLRTPVILGLNKTDALGAEGLREQEELAAHLGAFDGRFSISALTGEGLPELLEALLGRLPEGPQYYPDGMLTDQPEKNIAAELIREAVLQLTWEEVPHAVAVEVERMEPRTKSDIIDIEAFVFVERQSQKGIVIGEGGRVLKEIGTRARAQLEALLGSRIFLDLRVKVRKNWRKDEAFLERLGY